MNQGNTQPKFSIRKSAIVGGVSVVIALIGIASCSMFLKKATPDLTEKVVEVVKTENKEEKQEEVKEIADKQDLTVNNYVTPSTSATTKKEEKPIFMGSITNVIGDTVETKEVVGENYNSDKTLEVVYEYDNTKLNTFSYTKAEFEPEVVKDIFEVTYKNGNEVSRNKLRTEVVSQARPKVVVLGTIVQTTETIEGETFNVAFETENVESENLLIGQSEEQFAGENGVSRKVYDVVYHDGKEVSRNERVEVVYAPKNKIIAHGVKEIRTTTENVVIEKQVVNTEDEDMLASANPIITKQGSDGEKRVTTTETYIRGQKINTEVTEEVITPMVEEHRTVGVLSYTERTENVTVEKTTEYEKDTSMFDGEERVIEEGSNGENQVTYTEKRIRGNVVETTVKQTTEVAPMRPKRVATGSIIRTFERTPQNVPIEITTKEVESEDLLVGQTQEQFAGEVGTKEVTTVVEKHDGVPVNTTTEERVVTPMKQRIVLVGTKEVEVSETEEPIAITDEISYDESRLTTTPDVITDGTAGVATVRTTTTKVKGQVRDTQVTKTVKTPMVTKKIIKGSKQITPNAESVTRTIKYVDKLGNDLQAPTVQTLSFTKTSWINKSDVEWESAKEFESVPVPTFEKYTTTQTVPTESVEYNAQDKTITIRYENKTVEEESSTEYSLKHWLIEGNNRFKVLKRDKVQVTTYKTKDVVTNEYVGERVQTTDEIIESNKLDDIRFTYARNQVNESNKDIIIFYNANQVTSREVIDFFMAKPEEERQELSQLADNKLPTTELTQDDLNYLFSKLDRNVYQQEMVRLINEERVKVGRQGNLQLAPVLDVGTQVRATEQAEIGYLRSIDENGDGIPDKAHYRPDGTLFNTAFNGSVAHPTYLGENVGQDMDFFIERLISEKELAKKHFEQFKASPGHYRNMISDTNVYGSFAFAFADKHLLASYKENGQSVLFVQIYGIEGFNGR